MSNIQEEEDPEDDSGSGLDEPDDDQQEQDNGEADTMVDEADGPGNQGVTEAGRVGGKPRSDGYGRRPRSGDRELRDSGGGRRPWTGHGRR